MAGPVKVVAWLTDPGWEAVVDALAGLRDPRVTLLAVVPGDVVEAPAGLLGRHRPGPPLEERLTRLGAEGAQELLAAAAARLRAPAETVVRTGRVEHEVLAAAGDADVLVLARDPDHRGPRSLGHAARFVVDHATCAVLLVSP